MYIKTLNIQYLMKLISSLVSSISVYATVFYISHNFGPKIYGDYEFLNTIFQSIIQILDAGLSLAIYRKMSMTDYKKEYYRIFILWNILVPLLFFMGLYLFRDTDVAAKFFISNENFFIAFIAISNIFIWNVDNFKKTFDSIDETVKSEKINISIKLLSILSLIIIYFLNVKNIYIILLKDIILNLFFIILSIIIIRGLILQIKHKNIYKEIISEIIVYIKPLYVYAVIALGSGVIERMILQSGGGSIQQGFFSIALRIISIGSLLLAPMIPLIIREVSRDSQIDNLKNTREIYLKNLNIFFSISAFTCAYVSQNTYSILKIVGGEEYFGAAAVLCTLCFYQLHQCYGQINGTILLGVGKTKFYKNIGIFGVFLGVILTWVLVSNSGLFSYNLGAFGLALKMVVVQLIVVSIETYYISKLLKIKFNLIIRSQIIITAFSFVLIYFSQIISKNILDEIILELVLQFIIASSLCIVFYLLFKKHEIFKVIYL